MTRKLLIAGLLAAVATPLLAQAVAPVAPMAPMAPQAVRPMADRIVTRAEVDAKVRTHFARMDTDRDGFITTAEVGALHGGAGQRWQRGGIGHVMNVQRGDPNQAFDRIDANRDGSISRDEFSKGREVRIEKRIVTKDGVTKVGDGKPGERMRMRRMGGMGGGMMGGAMILKMADTNKDGRISLAEATAGSLAHFDMMDANRDGRLTPEERRAGRARIVQMHKAS